MYFDKSIVLIICLCLCAWKDYEAERRNNEYAMNPTDFAASMALQRSKVIQQTWVTAVSERLSGLTSLLPPDRGANHDAEVPEQALATPANVKPIHATKFNEKPVKDVATVMKKSFEY